MNNLAIHIYENKILSLNEDESHREEYPFDFAGILWLLHQKFQGMRIISYGATKEAAKNKTFPVLLKGIMWVHIDLSLSFPDRDLGEDPLQAILDLYKSQTALDTYKDTAASFVRQLDSHPDYFKTDKQEYANLLSLHTKLEERLLVLETNDLDKWRAWAQKSAQDLLRRGDGDKFILEFHKIRVSSPEVNEAYRKISQQYLASRGPKRRRRKKKKR